MWKKLIWLFADLMMNEPKQKKRREIEKKFRTFYSRSYLNVCSVGCLCAHTHTEKITDNRIEIEI